MRRRIRPLAVIAISAAVGIVSIASRGIEPSGWDRVANAAETVRIQQHLARVEAELAGGDVSRLSLAQRSERSNAIAALCQYEHAGHFPHNHDFPSQRVPYFQDRHGTPSEIAYLLAQSGRQDLVDRMATTDNNGTIFEMVNDPRLGPALRLWLDQEGLTVDEVARMQTFYGDP